MSEPSHDHLPAELVRAGALRRAPLVARVARRRSWLPRTFPPSGGAARTEQRSRNLVEPGSNEDDARLVAAMSEGDRRALAALYDRHAGVLLAVAQRILVDRREAEDLLHDVFLEAWRQAETYDPSRASVRAWLLVRLRSRALDRKRSVGVARVVPTAPDKLHDAIDSGEDDLAERPDRARVRRALGELTDEQRVVLELGYFEGLSSSEIAARLEIPVGTVKSRVAAAMSRLRAELLPANEGGSP